MKKINFNFKSIVQGKARWLLTILAIFTLGIGQMWADDAGIEGFGLQFRDGGSSGTTYFKTGTKGEGGIQDVNFGTKTDLKIVYIYATGNKNSGNLCTDYCYFKYEIYGTTGTEHWGGLNRGQMGGWYSDNKKNTYKWGYENGTSAIYDANGSFELTEGRSPGSYRMEFYLTYNRGSSCDEWPDVKYSGGNWKFYWTVPGFSSTSVSKNFGTTLPVGSETETTISFGQHYGTALTTSNCSITGTNASEFEVWSISETGVQVGFTPTTAGSKTATLTITDAHSKTCTITLTATATSNGTKTRMYFNDYKYGDAAGDWAAASAKYRFSLEYNTGVYTHYLMTKVANTEHTYSANVEIQSTTVNIDRYNPSKPYTTHNTATPSGPALSSTNPYAKSTAINGAYATNHPLNDVTGGTVYYDNSKSGFTSTLYLIVGRDTKVSDNTSDTYSTGYAMNNNITNSKLYYHTFSETEWHDATYYAVIGASSAPGVGGNWGSSSLSTKADGNGYTAAFTDLFGLLSGSTYLASAPSKTGGAMTISQSPTLITTQTFNYALSTDGGSTYSSLTSGVNTPGKLKLESYYYNGATSTAKNDDQTLDDDGTTYSKEYGNVGYLAKTTLTASDSRDGYTFEGWYFGNTQKTDKNTVSYTYYPSEDSTFTARYKAHRYRIDFSANDAQYPGTTSYGSMESMSNVVYDQEATLTANGFHRIGYKFEGWATTANGSVAYADKATAILNLTTTDGGSATLYAKWSTDANTFTNESGDGDWTNDANWSGDAPTNDDATITINQPVTISGTSVHVGEISFGTNGKLTIAKDGALEVAGNITNNVASKIEINSDGSNQGALIFNSTGSTSATVNMTMNAATGKFQFIAIPVSYVSVSEKFPGSTVYTYGWSNTKHDWERRGYYDGFSSFEAVLVKGQGSASFSGNLVATGERGYSGTYSADNYGYVYMYGNSWTAPITMSEEGFDNASIGIMNGSANSWDGVIAGQVIPALQAFAVAVNSGGGSITINYDRDVRNPSNSNAPLKAPQRLTSEVQEPITVYVSGNEMQTRIRLFEDATRFTDEFDNGWEALYMEGYGYAGEMYAIGTDKMNVLATNNLEGTVVGFVPGQAENYTISFEGDGKGYYLNDIKMEEATLIDEGNTYEFTSDEKTNATRFVISKTPIKKTPTSVENIGDGVKARKQMINGALYIIRDGRIYNAEGSLVK